MNTTVIMCHGIDQQNPQYAAALIKQLPPDVQSVQLYWEPATNNLAKDILNLEISTTTWKKMQLKDIRKIVNAVIIDAYAWYSSSEKNIIKTQILSQLQVVPAGNQKILVLHSLGCIIMLDMLFGGEIFPGEIVKIFTCGCPLFIFDMILQKMPEAVPHIWKNFYHPLDVLAAPLSEIVDIEDIEITDGGIPNIKLWDLGLPFVGLAHNVYWKSQQFARAIIEEISG